MKNVMKRAWEIYRTLTGDHIAKLSAALRQAWNEVKRVAKSIKEQCIERLETIVANSCTYDYCVFEIRVSDWQKHGKDRTYLSIIEKAVRTSKHYKVREYGYVDNVTGTYVPGKEDLRKNYTFSGASF